MATTTKSRTVADRVPVPGRPSRHRFVNSGDASQSCALCGRREIAHPQGTVPADELRAIAELLELREDGQPRKPRLGGFPYHMIDHQPDDTCGVCHRPLEPASHTKTGWRHVD